MATPLIYDITHVILLALIACLLLFLREIFLAVTAPRHALP